MAYTFDQALDLAKMMKLSVTPADIRRLLNAPPPSYKREVFSSQEYWDFYNIIHGEHKKIEAVQHAVLIPHQHITRVLTEDLAQRYTISEVGIMPMAEISRDQVIADIRSLDHLDGSADRIKSSTAWMRGDLLNLIADDNGQIDLSEFADPDSPQFKTYATTMRIAGAFPIEDRDPEVTFTHYKELFYARGLEAEDKSRLLQIAKNKGLTCKETRKLASYVKNQENVGECIDTLETEPSAVTTALQIPRRYHYFRVEGESLVHLPIGDQDEIATYRTTTVLERKDENGNWRTFHAPKADGDTQPE